MKARDVIKNWPQNPSSSKPYEAVCEHWWYSFRGWSNEDIEMAIREDELNRRYHGEQTRMMDDWNTKTGRFAPLDRRIHFEVVGFMV